MKPKKETTPKEDLLKAMEVGESSVEGASYVATQYQKVVTEARALDRCAAVLNNVYNYARDVAAKLTSGAQSWFAEPVETSGDKNMKVNKASSAAKILEEEHKKITFGIAVNDQSAFLRGYKVDGQSVSGELAKPYDTVFVGYLAENNIKPENGFLYELDKEGVKVNPDKFKELISDPDKGFSQYAASKNLDVAVSQQEYPAPEAQKETRNEADQSHEAESQSNMRAGA